jgi:hypothetical protein
VLDGGGWYGWGSDVTELDGSYDIGGLEAGTHRVEFKDLSGEHMSEWYAGAATIVQATDVPVGEHEVVPQINASLVHAGGIFGTVTDGVDPVTTAYAIIYEYDEVNGYYSFVASADVNGAGEYEVSLAPGEYRVGFGDSTQTFATEYWNDEASVNDAQDVTVTAGHLEERNAALVAAASIEGTVSDGTDPVTTAYVLIYRYDPDEDSYVYYGNASVQGDGTYEVGGLTPGNYKIGFRDGAQRLVPEFWNDKATLEEADDLDLEAGEHATAIDAALAPGATIAGTVTDTAGAVEGIEVIAYKYDVAHGYYEVGSALTANDGTYNVFGLAPGSYRLGFSDLAGDLLTEYWDDQPTLQTADEIDLVEGERTENKDAVLAVAGSVSGTVTDGTGPAQGVDVQILQYEEDGEYYANVTDARTDQYGRYTLTGLAPGSYKVRFSDQDGRFVPEYWNDKATLDAADDIEVASAEHVEDKDAVLAAAASIAGTVTDGTHPLQGISVSVYRYDPTYEYYESLSTVTTDADGDYVVGGLVPGDYRLGFSDDDGEWGFEYWDDATSVRSAADIPVGEGEQAADMNAVLQPAGTIEGTVTSGGDPVEDIIALAFAYDPEVGSYEQRGTYTTTAADGSYVIGGLAPGSYRVGFQHGEGDYVTEYWDDQLTIRTAEAIPVAEGEHVTDKHADLAPGASISGTVTHSAGSGTQLYAVAYILRGGEYEGTAYAGVNGTGDYEFVGLTPGSYRIGFFDDDYRLVQEYWNDQPTLAAAEDIDVAIGAEIEGKDAQLATRTSVTNDEVPTISGTPQVGTSLSVDPGQWSPRWALFTYQWLANGEVIAGATEDDYTPTVADIGKTIAVQVTGSSDGLADGSVTSAGTGPVTAASGGTPTPAVSNTNPPSISGDAEVGAVLTADGGTWSPAGTTLTYQWLADGAPVVGATGATYMPTVADLGKTIRVRVTASKPGSVSGELISAGVGPVTPAVVDNVVAPSVSGTPKVGRVLTADGGTWDPSDAALAFQWLRDGVALPGATDRSYTTVVGDLGSTIAVRVTASKPGAVSAVATSAAVGPVTAASVDNVVAPSVSGTPEVGKELTADGGTWDPADATLAYQWLRDGVPLAGATAPAYTPVAGDLGRSVAVRVTASAPGAAPATATSAAVGPVVAATLDNVTAPRVTGKAKVGSALTAQPGTWSPAGATFDYQWLVDGRPVAGKTSGTFQLWAYHLGKQVSVRVTASKAGLTDAVAASGQTARVDRGTIRGTGLPEITGAAQVGRTLSVSRGEWEPGEVRVTYQWLLNNRAVRGATGKHLEVTRAMRGKKLSVRVTVERAGYVTETVTTRPSTEVD